MDFQAISSVVSKLAPDLGQAISLVNPMAGIAVSLISKVFGANPTDDNDLIAKINNDPEAAVKLKQIEMDHANLLLKLKTSNLEKTIDDHISARQSEIEKIKLTGKRDWVIDVLAIMVVLFFFISLLAEHFIKPINNQLLNNAMVMILSYYFGSSIK